MSFPNDTSQLQAFFARSDPMRQLGDIISSPSFMPAVIFFAVLDFGKNCYSRTTSCRGCQRKAEQLFVAYSL
ncbi:MAG: hypothetical protein B1H11_07415 [Desulfobacteraceae bacterium 4484_190.1]|nr:MAG: hypothetical protein B1H11_07415 [Desulfobacteraceae bacterium 4484_190.1]